MSERLSAAVQLLSELIRARSCNPPGNEAAAAGVLGAYLRRAGIGFTVYESDPGRANLVARVRGSDHGPSLLLLSHLDTVDADPAEWSTDPWGGVVRDGSVWGRGALDLKGQAAAQAVALASLLSEGVVLRGDVVLAATADEERGSQRGTQWLTDTHPEALRADYALTHGAGDRIVLDDRVVYLCAVAERAHLGFTVTLTAPPALAMLAEYQNVIVQAGRFIGEVAGQHVGDVVPNEVAVVVRALTRTEQPPARVTAAMGAVHPALETLLAPLTGPTLTPSRIASSVAAGTPSVCEIDFECWLPSGQDRRAVERLVTAAAGDLTYQTTWRPIRGGSRSPVDTDLWRAVHGFVESVDPGAVLLPLCDAGFTDSHWLRERYGTVAYGFFPMRDITTSEAARAVHGPDEHLPLRDLELQVDFYRHAITTVCGESPWSPLVGGR